MIPILSMKYESYVFCTLDMTMLLVSSYPKTIYLCGLFPEKLFFGRVLCLSCHEIE